MKAEESKFILSPIFKFKSKANCFPTTTPLPEIIFSLPSINIFSKNGYLLSFNLNNGNLNYLNRISKNGISSEIVFLNNNMLFFDSDNRLLKFN